jgi:PAS domain-containing protein
MNTETGDSGIFCAAMAEAAIFEKAVLVWINELDVSGLIITDRDLKILCWNRWMEEHTGKTSEEAAWRPLLEVFPDIAARGRDLFFQMALKGQPSVLSYGIHHHLIPIPAGAGQGEDGLMPQAARIYPLKDGDRVIGTLTRIEDVTDRVRREK